MVVTRRAAYAIACSFKDVFSSPRAPQKPERVDCDGLYDFFYTRNYDAWFCNEVTRISKYYQRELQEFFLRLQTGETLANTTHLNPSQRIAVGRALLLRAGEDMLTFCYKDARRLAGGAYSLLGDRLLKELQLEGYSYQDGKLLAPEAELFNTEEQAGVLETLYRALGLSKFDTAKHCLELSASHWLAGKWDDCINNSRRFFEQLLADVAIAHGERIPGDKLKNDDLSWPVRVRDYLERVGLLEKKEKEAIASLYGLLSKTGSHPYIAANDQARLLRQLALVMSEFVLLRFKNRLSGS